MTPLAEDEALKRFIYIAGPISNGNKLGAREIHRNVKRGIEIYMQLVEKGYNPICPHFSHYGWLEYDTDIKWQTWLTMDENYVKVCPLFFYMEPKVYGESKGALHEYKLAKALEKTIYTRVKDMPNLSEKVEVPA